MTALPVLYSFRRCPYAMRARLALAASGTVCELREVKLAAKPAAMLEASPKGTVPVLVLADGTVIEQSLEVMHWALAQNDPEGWLHRNDPALVARNDGAFKHDLDRYKYPERHGSDALAHRESGLAFLRDLEARLAAQGQLCGAQRGLADMAVMPFVRQFASVDADWFARLELPNVQRWLAGHVESALFGAVMGKFAPWQDGDARLLFPA
ncbi:MAG: glutathione S-transferase [Novosphingobium sp. 32-60-15]|uniref:glutathione S-transferase n=1 Tax=unclassified Novosphingobium TaxID=2644732 RepID=UPI000BD2438D|nr:MULTISPECIES: glutathione S-transferase [unclassified Novosphingobium]OYX60489.1 MAG: glutathione S-transferase [Novosphingobium sp. 32-60-15]